MVKLHILSFYILVASSFIQAQPCIGSFRYGQQVIMCPGDSASRQFGDMEVRYILNPQGTGVQCSLFLSTQLVYIGFMTATSPSFSFDLQVGNGKCIGTFYLELNSPSGWLGPCSKLYGEFTYTSNGSVLKFKGDLVGWFVKP